MIPLTFEPYIPPEQAAAFLAIPRLTVIRMARAGKLPAHPVGDGKKRQWRFKLSELDEHMKSRSNTASHPFSQKASKG